MIEVYKTTFSKKKVSKTIYDQLQKKKKKLFIIQCCDTNKYTFF